MGNVFASGGGLRKNSIKTCPNGVTYGLHSDGNGGTHWHIAITNGSNYYANGEAIFSDPCPNSSGNNGTAGSTDQSSYSNNDSSNNSENNNTTNYKRNNSSNSNNTVISKPKSSDTTIKSIKIDNENVLMSENMEYKTVKKNVDIEVIPNDLKSTVQINNKDLDIGSNIVTFNITAEDGTTKEYLITINRNKVDIKLTIKKFILGVDEVDFKNGKATINKLRNESSLEYSYELDDINAKVKILVDGKENIDKNKINNLRDESIIEIIVYDEYENQNKYEINVNDSSLIMTIIIYRLITLIILSPFVIIGVIIYFSKRKKIKVE